MKWLKPTSKRVVLSRRRSKKRPPLTPTPPTPPATRTPTLTPRPSRRPRARRRPRRAKATMRRWRTVGDRWDLNGLTMVYGRYNYNCWMLGFISHLIIGHPVRMWRWGFDDGKLWKNGDFLENEWKTMGRYDSHFVGNRRSYGKVMKWIWSMEHLELWHGKGPGNNG